jgi:hypothetical protein
MQEPALTILVEGPEETIAAIRAEMDSLQPIECWVTERKHLGGEDATWIVAATLMVQVVPHILTFISSMTARRQPERPTKITVEISPEGKANKIEIENPSSDDLERLRQFYKPT